MNFASRFRKITGQALLTLSLVTPIALGTSLSVPVMAQDAATAEKEYTLKKREYKANEVQRTKMTLKFDFGGQQGTLAMKMRETVKAVKPEGELSVQFVFEEAMANIGGMELDISNFVPKVTVNRDKKGKVTTEVEGGSEQSNSQFVNISSQFATAFDNVLPEKPIKVGEKWDKKFKTTGPDGAEVEVEAKYEFAGIEKVNGVEAMKILTKSKTIAITSEGMMLINPKNSALLKTKAKAEIDFMGMKGSQEIETELIMDDKKDAPKDKP